MLITPDKPTKLTVPYRAIDQFGQVIDVLVSQKRDLAATRLPRHRNTEFLKFLRTIDREVPRGLQVHMILDNYGTHKHPNVKKWLDAHPRFHCASSG